MNTHWMQAELQARYRQSGEATMWGRSPGQVWITAGTTITKVYYGTQVFVLPEPIEVKRDGWWHIRLTESGATVEEATDVR